MTRGSHGSSRPATPEVGLRKLTKHNHPSRNHNHCVIISDVTGTRTYGEGCAAAHALDLVGERWALLLVRELLLGPKRFTDLRAGVIHASPNVLAQRLRDLEQAGIVRRRKLPPPAASRVYELTEWGLELEPVVTALGRWGARSPAMPHEAPMSVDSHILAMRTMFDPDLATFQARYGLRLDDAEFQVTVSEGRFEIDRGASAGPDATIVTDPATLAALLWLGQSLDDALASGRLSIEGDVAAAARLVGLFPSRTPLRPRFQPDSRPSGLKDASQPVTFAFPLPMYPPWRGTPSGLGQSWDCCSRTRSYGWPSRWRAPS